MSDPLPGRIFAQAPTRVRIVEVGPRDGLQNESAILPTEDKARYVEMLARSGLSEIEVSSFVSPTRVPQLADAAEVFAALPPMWAIRRSALVPNRKGLERALTAGVDAIAVFTAASETFNQKNSNRSIAGSLEEFAGLIPVAREAHLPVRAYVSAAFVCPFEGPIAPEAVVRVAVELDQLGVDEISFGDTVGRASPIQVARLLEALEPALPREQIALHFHDTYGIALANVLVGLQYGVAVFDAAAGGAGGCPFAPGAPGNLATEDLVWMLTQMGIETGIDPDFVAAASRFLEHRLGRRLPARYLQRGRRGRQ